MSRKLDAAIAEALGYEVREVKRHSCGYIAIFPFLFVDGVNKGRLPRYSADGNDMLELEREMHQRGYALNIAFYHIQKRERFYCVCVYEGVNKIIAKVDADTMPKAVALAAYKALTGKEWSE